MNTPASEVPVDPFGLVDSVADIRPIVWFGDVDVSGALLRGSTKNSINEMASATLELDPRSRVLADIDFASQVILARGHRDAGRVFTGYTVEVMPGDQHVTVECQGNPALHDPMSGGRISKAPAVDTIHAVLREAGVPEAGMQLHGLDQLPLEVFEVVSPVNGLALSSRMAVGNVVFLPAGSAQAVTELLNIPESPYVEEFRAAKAYAVTYVTAARTYDAERAALDRIDVALAWVNVRIRFAGAVTPSGQLVGWNRARLKQLASRSELITGRGLLTNRSWLNHLAPPLATELALTNDGGAQAELVASNSGLRGAVKAAARAISSPDPLTKITAISECLEFYVGSTHAPYEFTKGERRALRRAAQEFSRKRGSA